MDASWDLRPATNSRLRWTLGLRNGWSQCHLEPMGANGDDRDVAAADLCKSREFGLITFRRFWLAMLHIPGNVLYSSPPGITVWFSEAWDPSTISFLSFGDTFHDYGRECIFFLY